MTIIARCCGMSLPLATHAVNCKVSQSTPLQQLHDLLFIFQHFLFHNSSCQLVSPLVSLLFCLLVTRTERLSRSFLSVPREKVGSALISNDRFKVNAQICDLLISTYCMYKPYSLRFHCNRTLLFLPLFILVRVIDRIVDQIV